MTNFRYRNPRVKIVNSLKELVLRSSDNSNIPNKIKNKIFDYYEYLSSKHNIPLDVYKSIDLFLKENDKYLKNAN